MGKRQQALAEALANRRVKARPPPELNLQQLLDSRRGPEVREVSRALGGTDLCRGKGPGPWDMAVTVTVTVPVADPSPSSSWMKTAF